MKRFNKVLSLVISATVMIMHINFSFANTVLDQAQRATTNAPKTFDGTTPSVKADIGVDKTTEKSIPNTSSINKATEPPKQDPKEPGFLTKVGWDVVNNKESYIALGVASGFLGFLLGGPIGAIIGIGAMFAFTVSQRAWYIKDFAKKPK